MKLYDIFAETVGTEGLPDQQLVQACLVEELHSISNSLKVIAGEKISVDEPQSTIADALECYCEDSCPCFKKGIHSHHGPNDCESTVIDDLITLHNSMHTHTDENIGFRWDIKQLITRHAPDRVEELK